MSNWILDWMTEEGAKPPPKQGDFAERELELIRSEFGELPEELGEWILGDFGRRGYFHMFPVDGGVLPVLLPHDPWNRVLIPSGESSLSEGYASLVEVGAAASHPLVLAINSDTLIVAEAKGPRAGWLFYLDMFYPRKRGQPFFSMARPIARSITECFEGFRNMVEAGVLSIGELGLGRPPEIDAPYPPLDTPMIYAGRPSVSSAGMMPWVEKLLLPGTVREVLGFDPPTSEDGPPGAAEMFVPVGGWVEGSERVRSHRLSLGLPVE